MKEQILDTFKDQSEKMLAPSREMNKLAVAKLEKLAALQLASLREYTDMNLARLKAATEISSPEAFQQYFTQQRDFMKTVGEKLTTDAKAMTELGKEFSEEAQKLTRDSFAAAGQKVA